MAKKQYIFALISVLLAALQPTFAFWRLQCFGVVARGRIDPIISPGEVSQHVHTVKGANSFYDNVTVDELLAASCSSCQVQQDKSAYWSPQLYFANSDGTMEVVEETAGHLTYYKYTPAMTSQGMTNPEPMPNGLRMISGDPFRRNFSLPVPDPAMPWTGNDATQEALAQKAIGFNCLNYARTPEPSLYRHFMPEKSYLDANCRDGLRLEVLFPYCWNGELDSADHKSHLAFPDALLNGGRCPAGYDRVINQLFFETIYPVQNYVGRDGFFTLAMGDPTGNGLHGDVLIAWDEGVLAAATEQCGPLNGPGANGVITDCPVFDVTAQAAQAQCKIPAANYPVQEEVLGALTALPGDNPLQYGPEEATMPSGGPTAAPPVITPPAAENTLPYSAATTSDYTDDLGNIYLQHQSSAAAVPTGSPGSVFLQHDSLAAASAAPTGSPATTYYSTQGNTVVEYVLMTDVVTVTQSAQQVKRSAHAMAHAARARRPARHAGVLS